jgi:hypothetical protein
MEYQEDKKPGDIRKIECSERERKSKKIQQFKQDKIFLIIALLLL